jgi:hypothetical protein
VQVVAEVIGVFNGVLVVIFGGMWLWYGSCKATFDTEQVVLSRWGRNRFLAAWADVDVVVFYTHLPRGLPRIEVIVRGDGPSSTGRHSGATKGALPLVLTWQESDDAADILLEECSRQGVHAEQRRVDVRARWLSDQLRRLTRKARSTAAEGRQVDRGPQHD